MNKVIGVIFLLFFQSFTMAEEIEYQIYELSQDGSYDMHLVAEGKREYTLDQVEVIEYEVGGRRTAEKYIRLHGTYKVGARIFWDHRLTGFGLLAKKNDDDFSWEWFNLENGVFEKLKGNKAHASVKTVGFPMLEELTEVKLIHDTELGFIEHSQGSKETHLIVLKAGSVLRFK